MFNPRTIVIEFIPAKVGGRKKALVSFWRRRGYEKIPRTEYVVMKHNEFELVLSKCRKR